MASCRGGARHRPRHGAERTAELGGVRSGVERAAPVPRLDNDDGVRQRRDEAVARTCAALGR